jgi:ABC-2 type transport system ATP-binding protein
MEIEVEKLVKDYGRGRGVFGVGFGIEKGETFGFLGPNGAGKTTTIRHIMGFSRPQSGETRVKGMESFSHYYEILKYVGYLPGEVALPLGLSGNEFLEMMRGLRRSSNFDRIKYLLEKFKLNPAMNVKRMSLGDKRKLAVVAAFMDDPEILVLDEPTSGLDPIMQEVFIDFIKEEKSRGKTILLSSHIFREVDAVCDRISIIKDGKIVDNFSADEAKHGLRTYVVDFSSADGFSRFRAGGFTADTEDKANNRIKISLPEKDTARLISVLSEYGVKDFREEPFSLQDRFMKFYDRSGNGEN